MTPLEIYVFFVLPLIALAMAGGALWLTGRDAREAEGKPKPSE